MSALLRLNSYVGSSSREPPDHPPRKCTQLTLWPGRRCIVVRGNSHCQPRRPGPVPLLRPGRAGHRQATALTPALAELPAVVNAPMATHGSPLSPRAASHCQNSTRAGPSSPSTSSLCTDAQSSPLCVRVCVHRRAAAHVDSAEPIAIRPGRSREEAEPCPIASGSRSWRAWRL